MNLRHEQHESVGRSYSPITTHATVYGGAKYVFDFSSGQGLACALV